MSRGESRPAGRSEWLIVYAWALALLVVVAAPVWHGYRVAPPGWSFSGFSGSYHNDYNGYLAWMRQAEEGHLLFRNLYTTEPHGRIFLHPLFWLMGATAGFSGIPIIAVWHVVQALGCLLMVYSIYRLASEFTDDVSTRMLALGLATTASGFGWLVGAPPGAAWLQTPIDLWMAEGNQFQALLTSFFILPIALAFLLLAFVYALRHFRYGANRDAVIAGLFALALACTHPYDMVSLYAVLAVWTWIAGRRQLRGLAIIVAISLPYCLYSVAVIALDPVFSELSWSMPSPATRAVLLGFGLPLLLAALAPLLPGVWRDNRDVGLLLAWLAIGLALLSVPIGFERRLIWGLHVVICVLAAMAWTCLLRSASRSLEERSRPIVVAALSAALVGFSSIGSIWLYTQHFERNRAHLFGDYLPSTYLDAMRWIDEHSDHADVVLASPRIAALLPGRSGVTVFSGHWAQTIDRPEKEAFVRSLFGAAGSETGDMSRILARNRVRFIALDVVSVQEWNLRQPAAGFSFASLADLVFQNDDVAIWKVRSADSFEPWRGGSWRGP